MAFARLTRPLPLRRQPGTAGSAMEVGQEVGCCSFDPCQSSACHLNPPERAQDQAGSWHGRCAIRHGPVAWQGLAVPARRQGPVWPLLLWAGGRRSPSSLTSPEQPGRACTCAFQRLFLLRCLDVESWVFPTRARGTGWFSQKLLVVVVPCFRQIFVPLAGKAGATSQRAVLRSGRRTAPEEQAGYRRTSRRVWQGVPQGASGAPGSAGSGCAQPPSPARGGPGHGRGVAGDPACGHRHLRADPGSTFQKRFFFWVEKNHFSGCPEPGKLFLVSSLVRAALV